MERLSRPELLMQMAHTMAQRGTCSRLQVGVVFSKNGRIISTGYNGAPAGVPHCEHVYWQPGTGEMMPRQIAQVIAKDQAGPNPSLHLLFDRMTPDHFWLLDNGNLTVSPVSPTRGEGCRLAGHAEANGIAFASRHGLSLEGANCTVTHMPCYNCALLLVNAGIAEVVYDIPYRSELGVELLRQAGIKVIDFSSLSEVEFEHAR